MYCTGFGDTWFQAFGQDELDGEQSESEDDPSAKDTQHAGQRKLFSSAHLTPHI